MKKLIFSLIAGATVMTAAHAEGPYVGVGVATAERNVATPAGSTGISGDGYKASGKVFGGYDIDKTWGVELGYTDFRNSSVSYANGGTSTSTKVGGHAVYLAGKGNFVQNDQFSLYGKLGVAQTHYNQDNIGSGNKTDAYGALGAQYNLSKQVALIGEYERYGKNKDFGPKPNVWTVGMKYNF